MPTTMKEMLAKEKPISPYYNEPYNQETIDAFLEYDEMKTNKEKYKRYKNVNDLFADLRV